jgi:succinyl-diaminopimelate desuccinylase
LIQQRPTKNLIIDRLTAAFFHLILMKHSVQWFEAMTSELRLEEECLLLACDLVKIPSLTPVSPQLLQAARQSLDCLHAFLEGAGAICHRLTFQGGHDIWSYPVDNLYAEWRGDETLGHLCFIGHTDVVPTGDLALWKNDPFSGVMRDGFLWGRGATDMKGAVAAFSAAAASFARSGPRRFPKVSLVITTDEEWAAVNGTCKILEWMRSNGQPPSAFLIGEPSSPNHLGSHIKIGRRGSLCGVLHAKGIQGHAAYPELFENPNGALTLALAILSAQRWTDSVHGMLPTAFEAVALASGDFNATAIIPGEARALWNIRFTPQQTTDSLLTKLRALLEDPPDWARNHPNSADLARITVIGNTGTVSMPYYSPPSGFAALVSQSVFATVGQAPVLDAGGGTTDGRFIHPVFPSAEIVELGLPEKGGAGDPRQASGGMHQADERCSVADLGRLTQCYSAILNAFSESVS